MVRDKNFLNFLVRILIKSTQIKLKPLRAWHDHTYVDELSQITLSQVMENRGIVKVSQVRHVFAFFVLGGVDLSNKVFLEVLGLFVGSFGRRKFVRFQEIFFLFCFVRSTSRLFLDTGKYRAKDIFDGVESGRVDGCEREKEKF